jgi:cytochrome c oxidase assembly protein subunit 15
LFAIKIIFNALMKLIYNRNLHYFALLTAIVAILLIVAGATVTSTGSGDAVPDWPLSYGSLTPPMKGGILFEHSHRLIAGLTGLLIAILAVWLLRRESRKFVKWMGVAALLAVIVQATLGGLRVLIVSNAGVQDTVLSLTGHANLVSSRMIVAAIHAVLAQSIVCLIVAIAVMTSLSWIDFEANDFSISSSILRVNVILLAAVFLQLVLGAFVRHSGAGLIIPDFPLSFGRIIPPFGDLPNNPSVPFPISNEEFFAKLGIIILALVSYFFVRVRKVQKIGFFPKALLLLTIIQIILGAVNIWSKKSVFSTVPHVAIGAIILALCVALLLKVWRVRISQPEEAVPTNQPAKSQLAT